MNHLALPDNADTLASICDNAAATGASAYLSSLGHAWTNRISDAETDDPAALAAIIAVVGRAFAIRARLEGRIIAAVDFERRSDAAIDDFRRLVG